MSHPLAALAPVLQGLTVIEFEGLGPGPLAGRWLAQHGATVIALVRPIGRAHV